MKRISSIFLLIVLFVSITIQSPIAHAKVTGEVPTSETPTTETPTTEAVTSESPTNEAPTTEAVTTEAPTSETPTTENPTTEQQNNSEVKILHTNDIHGRLDAEPDRVIGMAKLKTLKDKEHPTFMFDSGDVFQGLPLSNFSKGSDMAKAMNAVGYDAMTVGNHEFDFGFETAMNYKKLLNFPILSSNVYKDGKSVYTPSTIIEKNGKKFGIIGVTTPETATKTHPNNIVGISFLDPVKSVTAEIDKLQGKVDAFIILSHLGIDTTTKEIWRGDYLVNSLANNKDYSKNSIIVLDGHSHSVIEDGELKNNIMLAQTGTALANIGKVTFNLKDKVATDMKASLIKEADTKDLTGDANVSTIVEEAKTNFGKATSAVVFHNKVQLEGERNDVRTRETNLGNAIADAMEAYSVNGFDTEGDFAVTNGGGIRASIEGNKDVTIGDIIKVLPFGNTITQIDVKGKNVKAMFEHALSAPVIDKDGKSGLDANGAFLHISKSIKVHYDLSKPAGKRVYAIEVLNKKTNKFEPLNESKTYKVVTNDFLAVGGDGFEMLGGPREEGPSLDAVVRQFFKAADMSAYTTTEIQRILAGNADSYKPEINETTTNDLQPNDKAGNKIHTNDQINKTNDKLISATHNQNNNGLDVLDQQDNVIPFNKISRNEGTSTIQSKDLGIDVQSNEPPLTTAIEQLPITGEAAGTGVAAIGLLGLGLYLVKRKSA